jgi:predicted AAA+ superfamily ATPase
MIEVYEQRIFEKVEEAKTWRAAWELSQESSRLKDKQLDELLEVARTTQAVLKALPSIQTKVSD